MNTFCQKDCKFKETCKVNKENTPRCKAVCPPDGTIFGRPIEAIMNAQQKKNQEKKA